MKKNFFRIISLLLILLILQPVVLFADDDYEEDYEEEEYIEEGFEDIFDIVVPEESEDNTPQQEQKPVVEYSKLSLPVASGIMPRYTDGGANVTRAKMAEYVAALAGYKITDDSTDITYFNDVYLENKSREHINYLRERGIVLGSGDGRFFPERTVTASEFAVCILRTAGYEEYISLTGGYPNGDYAKIGLTN